MKRQRIALQIAAGILVALTGSLAVAQDHVSPHPQIPPGVTTTPTPTPDGNVQEQGEEQPKMTRQERLEFMLSGYHFFPQKSELDALGTEAEVSELLRQLAENPDARVTMRSRAVDALAYYKDKTTVEFLTHLTTLDPNAVPKPEKRLTRSLKHHAIMSLGKALKEEAVPALGPALNDPDIQIRMTAISALGKHAGKAGKVRLNSLADTEKNPYVRRELRKYVKIQ